MESTKGENGKSVRLCTYKLSPYTSVYYKSGTKEKREESLNIILIVMIMSFYQLQFFDYTQETKSHRQPSTLSSPQQYITFTCYNFAFQWDHYQVVVFAGILLHCCKYFGYQLVNQFRIYGYLTVNSLHPRKNNKCISDKMIDISQYCFCYRQE